MIPGLDGYWNDPMSKFLEPFRFLPISLAGWMNQRPPLAIDYLREENRVLREPLGDRRLRVTDDQRRRLVVTDPTEAAQTT